MREDISENPVRPTGLVTGPEGKPREVSRETASEMKESAQKKVLKG